MSSTTRRLFYVDDEPRWLSDEELRVIPGVVMPAETGKGLPGYSEKRPGESRSMSCHPEQSKMMNDAMKEHGISGVEWDNRGRCQITSRAGRARAMPIVGNMNGMENVHDDSGGYGD